MPGLPDREDGALRVNAIHRDILFTAEMTAAITEEIEDLASWLPPFRPVTA